MTRYNHHLQQICTTVDSDVQPWWIWWTIQPQWTKKAVIFIFHTSKEVTRLRKCQRHKVHIFQCNLNEEFSIKSKYLNSFIFIVSNGKYFTFVINSSMKSTLKLSMLFPIWSKRKLILRWNHLQNPGTTRQWLSVNLDLYMLLYAVQHTVHVVCMLLGTCRLWYLLSLFPVDHDHILELKCWFWFDHLHNNTLSHLNLWLQWWN